MSAIHEPWWFDERAARAAGRIGTVTLVGAGPGDPDLLTVKAARALGEARVVLHDALVGDGVLALLPRGAHRIDVGKRCARHTLSQAGICELLVRLARAGHDVLRLKGGDPFVFGRGGEELEALATAGVPWRVIPGISAAQGAAAALGMPLTHRDHADRLVLATGHLKDGPPGHTRCPDLDWPELARPHQTVVIYMGVGALESICAQLLRHGLAADTPAATVENATQPAQRLTTATLQTLASVARARGVRPPALIVIGGVAGLPAHLADLADLAAQASQAGGRGIHLTTQSLTPKVFMRT